VFHLFARLVNNHNARVVFDLTYPLIDEDAFVKGDCKVMYGDVKESIPADAPIILRKEVASRLYFDSDHAKEKFTRRARACFVIYLKMAHVVRFSKKQPTSESSVFGDEFVALKNGTETVRGLRYMFWMMGVPLSGPCYLYGEHIYVSHNTQCPESMLKKKSNSICYRGMKRRHLVGMLFLTFAIDCCMITLLAEEVCGSLGFPCCQMKAARYVIKHVEFYESFRHSRAAPQAIV
jgi:hypothetical protein